MKSNRFSNEWKNILDNRAFVLLFFNASLRTRLSFEIGIKELGGHAQAITPEQIWLNTSGGATEALKDIAQVISRYAAGIGVRISLDRLKYSGEEYEILKAFENYSNVPIINMATDAHHPCQAFADLMGWSEYFSQYDQSAYIENLKKKKLLLTWASSPMIRPLASVQSHLTLAARLGMDIMLSMPKGYDIDPAVSKTISNVCKAKGSRFDISHDPEEGYDAADVVYARHWVSRDAYQHGQLQCESEKQKALKLKEWIVNDEKMQRSKHSIFANPMPVMRNYEATDAVIDSHRSVIYDVAENRLHVQKAILSLIGCVTKGAMDQYLT